MAGLDSDLVVLLHGISNAGDGKNIYGTGYFITRNLILTARHVVANTRKETIRVRLDFPDKDRVSPWISVQEGLIWESSLLDVALIRLTKPIPREVPTPFGQNKDFAAKQIKWDSLAYPIDSANNTPDGLEIKTAGLGGTFYTAGGGGQGEKELDLGVDYEGKEWHGISGAPVFVENSLVGIIKDTFVSYENRRLAATPVFLMYNDPGFFKAITVTRINTPHDFTWLLVLNAENINPELGTAVMAAIKRKKEVLERISGKPLYDEPITISLSEALSDPGAFLRVVQSICEAPIMVFDVTTFEPAVMLFLGIRAVARRGITLTTTTKSPLRSDLKKLPFNIQEIKLIDLSEGEYYINDPRHPINWIGEAIVKGFEQLRNYSNYFDLPAYNAVRCPAPSDESGEPNLFDKSLMLCPFDKDYDDRYWRYVSGKIAITSSPRNLERMLDIASPRLVGLALYESIRWTACCIVDWSKWSPNVFFEFGVRLACSDIGPVCLIETSEASPPPPAALEQHKQLLRLFAPMEYTLGGPIGPFEKAFNRFELTLKNQYFPEDQNTLGHNAVYQEIVRSYYWPQEQVSQAPHLEIIKSIKAQFGKDPQKRGNQQVLFTSNLEYAKVLRTSVQERYIAAWYYLKGRFTMDEYKSDPGKQPQLVKLGKDAIQWLRNHPEYVRICNEIYDTIDDLKSKK